MGGNIARSGEFTMKASTRLCRIAGTEVRIHWSFLLVFAWFVVLLVDRGHTLPSFAGAVGLFALAALMVILHELGHVMAARRFGIGTESVSLHAIGAVSKLEREASGPKEELWIAAAGPLVSLGLALPCMIVALLQGDSLALEPYALATGGWAAKLFWVNVLVTVLNLIPAIPMDGGKILHAVMRQLLPEDRAGRLAIMAGFVTAALFVVAGLTLDLFFLVMAAIVAVGARREAQRLRAQAIVREPEISAWVVTSFVHVMPQEGLVEALEKALASEQETLPVVSELGCLGLVRKAEILKRLEGGRSALTVRDVMCSDVPSLDGREALSQALSLMQQEGWELLPVVEQGGFTGIVRRVDLEQGGLSLQAQKAVFQEGA
jgi:Zn-dependent protease